MRRFLRCLGRFFIGVVITACVCSPTLAPDAIAQQGLPDDLPIREKGVPFNQPNVPPILPLSFVPMGTPPIFTPSNVNVSNLFGNESEVSIAVNPTNPQNMVICGHAPGLVAMNTFFTLDGGQTWTLVALGPAFDGQQAACDRGDPTVAFDDNGNVFVSYFTFRCPDNTRVLFVARSSDGGQSYQGPAIVADHNDGEVDKEIIGCGPDPSNPAQQNVYLAYRLEVGSDVQVHLAASYDGGVSFTSDEIINDDSIAGDDYATFGAPAVGPNGELYVVWDDESNRPTTSEIMVDVSFDGGVNWGTDVSLGTTGVTRDNLNRYDITAQPDRGILTVPCIAVDRTGGLYDGRVYVTYTVTGGGGFDDVDVVIQSSDDLAQNWTTPLVVNDDGGSGSQFLPWLTVDNCGDGAVAVAFLDTRNDPNDEQVQAFLAVSDDGGATFYPNIQVAAGQSDQSTSNPNRTGNNYLEYIGVDACDEVACLTWPDNSANLADLDFFSDCVCLTEVTLTCPGDIVVECSGSEGAPASTPAIQAFLNGVTGDGCGGNFTISNDAPPFFPLGTTTVTFSALDISGNTVTCEADVEVVDTAPPVITCPGDVTVECSDFCGVPDDDAQLNGFWAGVSATDVCCTSIAITNDAPACFPLGTTTVTFIATDCAGNADTCTADVTVEDTTPPEITVILNRDRLWPPNHKMADIFATVEVTDICCENPTFVLTSATSDEPDNGIGDGNTVNDIQDADIGTADTHIRLRSERQGGGDGRIYTIVYTASDCVGNTTDATVEVHVPHDHSGWAFASMGFAPSGVEFEPGARQIVLIIPSREAEYSVDENGNEIQAAEAFDATALDLTRVYVGNVKGVVVPERSLEIDNNLDDLMDLAVYYPARAVNSILSASEIEGEDYGTIGLHYVSAEGTDYLVPNIFELGEPVPVVPQVVIPRTDDTGNEGQPGGQLNDVPNVTALLPIYPNPFNPSTTIPFNLVSQERVALRIYSAQGKLVRTLKNETFPAGLHRVIWDGRDNNSQHVATGVYFVRFTAGSVESTRKVILIR